MNTPCPVLPDCERRFDAIEGRCERLEERQQTQGESIAALRAQVAAWAAIGSLVGGAIVALLGHFLK